MFSMWGFPKYQMADFYHKLARQFYSRMHLELTHLPNYVLVNNGARILNLVPDVC